MTLASLIPNQIDQLVVLDMAPVHYKERRHDNVLAGLEAVIAEQPKPSHVLRLCQY
ncbi:protein of unknown function [Vibrio tapetis subsp. tapetis]|uniref:Uncharacterized protein n=1 Tax=Vibrio tapetis subsp. tapetis TaxID=1671868 RepID=A0A2N8ZBJ8_9VIBR|nr:protein of unknown function [Vibrio tapetis subsp. tapetis]